MINALDPNSLTDLKRLARANSPEAVKATAQQFEAMFLQIVLKTMRESIPQGGLFDSDATRFYQGIYDQQLAAVLAERGGVGLARVLERQLSGQAVVQPPSYLFRHEAAAPPVGASPGAAEPARAAADSLRAAPASTAGGGEDVPGRFVDKLWSHARQAADSLGVPPHFLLGQAALETGWGRSELRRADGSASHNLFNIKAGRDWKGAVVEAATTEYENGVAQTRVERFRAYDSYAEAFADYAQLLRSAPRYQDALGSRDAASFARALARGGYATDPAYADKLTRVINGNTLRQGLVNG